jgi:hypothetical protein
VHYSTKCFVVMAACATLLAASPSGALPQDEAPASIFHPFPIREFHFSDSARDAEYWRLDRESERTAAVFRTAIDVARRALKHPAPAPGTPAWFEARAAVEQAILARRPARDAKMATIEFLMRERSQIPPSEAADALQIWRMREESLRASSDILVGLLAALAGIRIDQWPP